VVAGLGMGAVLAPLADIILAGVRQDDAGSASGVFNTAVQIGASIGIAVIGVIFFGLLGTQSAPAASAVAPQLRGALTAAGLPRAATVPAVTAFRGCLHDRLVSTDPAATPASCRSAAAGRLPVTARREIAAIGRRATGIDFAASVWRTLLFQVGVFLASFAMMLALPAARRGGRRASSPLAGTGEANRLAAEPVYARVQEVD